MHANLKYTLAFALALLALVFSQPALAIGALGISALADVTLETVANEFKLRSNQLTTAIEEVRAHGAELIAKTAAGEANLAGIKEMVDNALTKMGELGANVLEIQQKAAERANQGPEREKSWGEQLVESEAYTESKNRGPRRSFSTEVKQVTSAAAGGLVNQPYRDQLISLPQQRRVMRDLLRTIPIQSSSVDYAVQTSRTNAAAPVAEGAAKPYSDYAWSEATAPVRTIAHLTKITRQAMDDAPRLVGEIDQEMRYGLSLVEEVQILFGNNTGQNLHGIMPQATAFALPAGFVLNEKALATRVDVLRIAMVQAQFNSLFPSTGIVINDLDWAAIELTKTTDGAYLFANPQGIAGRNLWGIPVVATPAMTVDNFLTGNFDVGATLYDRMGVEVLISTENDKDFENNLATMRAEERIALAVKRPGAFVKGTFAAAVAAAQA